MRGIYVLLALLCCQAVAAQAVLLKDINPTFTDESSYPGEFTVVGNDLFFRAKVTNDQYGLYVTDGTASGTRLLMVAAYLQWPTSVRPFGAGVAFVAGEYVHGRELWYSDGTISGTNMIIDLNTGTSHGAAGPLGVLNNQIIFSGNDGNTGNELWVSDGTAAGTTLLLDINTGAGSSDPRDFTPVGNLMFFTATTPTTGRELWVTDGTSGGTFMLADIYTGNGDSLIENMTAVGTELYFSALTLNEGIELWKSDGTASGTVMIADIHPTLSSQPQWLTPLTNGNVIFSADDGTHGRELWITDGTTAGTQMIVDLHAGSETSVPQSLVSMGGYVMFSGRNNNSNDELWRTDGTAAGTTLVRDIAPGTSTGSWPRFCTRLGNEALFYANGGGAGSGLWKSDGTFAGTVLVATVTINPLSMDRPIVSGNGVAYFAGGGALAEPWITDGTGAGTYLIKNLYIDPEGSAPGNAVALGNRMLFRANDGTHGIEPWGTDGTTAGTQMLVDAAPGAASSSSTRWGILGNIAVFNAATAATGEELWVTDGTAAGTSMVLDINQQGTDGSAPGDMATLGGIVLFSANDGVNGRELWYTDGTAANTAILADIRGGASSSNPTGCTTAGNLVFFAANDGVHGVELWASNGTGTGTYLVRDINPSGDSSPANFRVFGNRVLFTANDGTHGTELWISAGTFAGTFMLLDINPGTANSSIIWFAEAGGYWFFSAIQAATGRELWRTDGTIAGTILLADAEPGATSGDPSYTSNAGGVAGNLLFYRCGSPGTGHEPWVSDGTPAGTYMLADINAGGAHSNAYFGGVVPGGFVFAATSAAHGAEMWFSDGTSAGTSMIVDIYPGPNGSTGQAMLGEVNGKVYFGARTPANGGAIWETDGTAAGTVMFAPMGADSRPVVISRLLVLGTRVYFRADTTEHGSEPWTFDPTNTSVAPTVTMAAGPITFTEGDPPLTLDATATITDPDSTTFEFGYLRLEVMQGASADNRLTIENQGTGATQVGVSGTDVTYGGVVIGSLAGGTGTTALVINFNAASTPAIAQAVLRAAQFEVASLNPTAATRIIEATVYDGAGGLSSPAAISVQVVPVNNLPVVSLHPSGSSFSGPAGGPFTASVQPLITAMQQLRLVLNDPDSVPVLTNVAVAPVAPAGINAPTAPASLHDGISLLWTGRADLCAPGTYTWTLTIEDGGVNVFVSVSITVVDAPPGFTNGGNISGGSGVLGGPYSTMAVEGTWPSLWVATVLDTSLVQSVSLVNVIPAASNPSNAFTLAMSTGTGPQDMYLNGLKWLEVSDAGWHDFTAEVTDGTHMVSIYIRCWVNLNTNFPPDIIVPPGSQFVRTAGTNTLTLSVDPGTDIGAISELHVFSINAYNVQIYNVVPPTVPPTGITMNYAGGSTPSPMPFNFSGVIQGTDAPQAYVWQVHVAALLTAVFDVVIQINNMVPGYGTGPDAAAGTGTAAAPFTAFVNVGDTPDLEIVQLSDANVNETLMLFSVMPAGTNPSGVFAFQLNSATRRLRVFSTGPLTGGDAGTHLFEVTIADAANLVSFHVRLEVQTPGGGGGGGSDDGGCTASAGANTGVIIVLAALAWYRRRKLPA